MKICVYCASSRKIDDSFFKATKKLAEIFIQHDIEINFGGGSGGLMGQLADTYIEHEGNIHGIMPQFMDDVEWGHKGVSRFTFTQTMAERKEKLIEGVDAVVTLAGGTGTFEELFEVLTLKRLGLFTKPIVILNTNGYYDPLKQMLERSVEEHFMAEEHLRMWAFVDTPEEVLPAIRDAGPWDEGAIAFAAIK